jgi:polar amino acid transport system permease protein
MFQYFDLISKGLFLTIKLSLCSLVVGLTLGLLGALARTSKYVALRFVGKLYSTLVRGIPELIWIFMIYFGLTALINVGLDFIQAHFNIQIERVEISAFVAGVCALSFCFGAYATEVFRGALLAIDKGQKEAAITLGLDRKTTFLQITLPQMFRFALPGIGNLFMILMKDTALVSVIGLNEIMRQTKSIISITKEPFTFYLIAAVLYLILTFITYLFLKYLEKNLFKWAYLK